MFTNKDIVHSDYISLTKQCKNIFTNDLHNALLKTISDPLITLKGSAPGADEAYSSSLTQLKELNLTTDTYIKLIPKLEKSFNKLDAKELNDRIIAHQQSANNKSPDSSGYGELISNFFNKIFNILLMGRDKQRKIEAPLNQLFKNAKNIYSMEARPFQHHHKQVGETLTPAVAAVA